MKSLVEELRAGAELEEVYDADGIIRIGYQPSLRWRAADEIERLRNDTTAYTEILADKQLHYDTLSKNAEQLFDQRTELLIKVNAQTDEIELLKKRVHDLEQERRNLRAAMDLREEDHREKTAEIESLRYDLGLERHSNERLRADMQTAAKLNLELMEIRRTNEAEIDRLRGLLGNSEQLVERLRGLLREGYGFPALDSEEREWKERVREALSE